MTIDTATKPVVILGNPVAHSRSPMLHNAAFEHLGLNFVYLAAAVGTEQLADAVAGLRALGFAGANVTLPHKQAVMAFADELSPTAEAVGAVNTLVVRTRDDGDRMIYGDNTDVAGFLKPLESAGNEALTGEAVVFGAGGGARAVVYGLLTCGTLSRLTIAARDYRKAEALAAAFRPYDERDILHAARFDEAGGAVCRARLVVNATPVGMSPDAGLTPWPHAEHFSGGQTVYDLIYSPRETRLLREAAARGARAIGGLEMLIGQAAAAFVQWTGVPFPEDHVRRML